MMSGSCATSWLQYGVGGLDVQPFVCTSAARGGEGSGSGQMQAGEGALHPVGDLTQADGTAEQGGPGQLAGDRRGRLGGAGDADGAGPGPVESGELMPVQRLTGHIDDDDLRPWLPRCQQALQ